MPAFSHDNEGNFMKLMVLKAVVCPCYRLITYLLSLLIDSSALSIIWTVVPVDGIFYALMCNDYVQPIMYF